MISFIYFDDYDMPGAKEGNCQKAVTGKNTAEDSFKKWIAGVLLWIYITNYVWTKCYIIYISAHI